MQGHHSSSNLTSRARGTTLTFFVVRYDENGLCYDQNEHRQMDHGKNWENFEVMFWSASPHVYFLFNLVSDEVS